VGGFVFQPHRQSPVRSIVRKLLLVLVLVLVLGRVPLGTEE